jgi:hypothetical protein
MVAANAQSAKSGPNLVVTPPPVVQPKIDEPDPEEQRLRDKMMQKTYELTMVRKIT